MKHLSHETLVMLLDGELAPPAERAAQQHLQQCDQCTRQKDSLAATMQASPIQPASQPDPAHRQLLASRLAEAATPQPHLWQRPRFLLQTAAAALLVAAAFAVHTLQSPLQDSMAAYEETGPKPIHAITPGAVRPVELAELCAMPDDDLDPAVPQEKQQAVFATYGLSAKQAKAYQVDYLINPQLGGNNDLENLWPEPYHATVWNASAKDSLEARLHTMVCTGTMPLEQAQQALATDWIAAYKKVFHADRPVRVQAIVNQR